MKYFLLGLLALLLAACDDGDDNNTQNTVKISVTQVSSGAYIVSVGDSDAPTVGKYYAGDDGSRLLLLNNAQEQAETLYRKAAAGDWTAVPAVTQNTDISLLRSDAISHASVEVASLAGTYVTQTAGGLVATFSIAADGSISAGVSDCKLSGTLSPSSLPNALNLRLNVSTCGDLPASSQGNLLLAPDYHPAAFRLVTDDGTQIVDLWGYVE